MKKYTLSYPYTGGPIDHWLTSGVLETDVTPSDLPADELSARQQILAGGRSFQLPFTAQPVELEPLEQGFWEVRHCLEDHRLDDVTTTPALRRVQRWATVRVKTIQSGEVTLQLFTAGPFALWNNRALVFASDELQPLGRQRVKPLTCTTHFKRGANTLFVLTEEAAYGPTLLSLGLSLTGACLENAALEFAVQNEAVEQRKAIEAIFRLSELSQPVFTRDDQVHLLLPEWPVGSVNALVKVSDPEGGIFGEVMGNLHPGGTIAGMYSIQLPAGPLLAHLTPPHGVFYDQKLRAERKIPFLNAPFPFFTAPEGEPREWALLAMQEMARQEGIFSELSKMLLGWWELVSLEKIRASIKRVERCEYGCLEDLLGLTSMATRLGRKKGTPEGLLPSIQAAVTGFPFPQPGQPRLTDELLAAHFSEETARLVLLTCQLLAGQKFPKAAFEKSGLTGSQERGRAEAALEPLLRQCAQWGWRELSGELDWRAAALAALLDLSKNDTVAELAAVLLDQMAFSLAQYSLQGTWAAPQLRAVPSQLKTGRLHPAAALNRILFGAGGYGNVLLGAFSLAISENYQASELIAALAQDSSPAVWTLERSARPSDGSQEGWEAVQALYKTPDYILASLLDVRPGEYCASAHAWQATLGPEALVFTNHPGSLDLQDGRPVGAWCGDISLPRVAQWQDALICLYRLPEQDPLRFTHAFFPAYAFDEVYMERGWYLARKGSAYLAITASNEAVPVTWGSDANCELRADGLQTAWLVQMGRQAVDGSFADFCRKVTFSPWKVEGLRVTWQTIRGERLEFDWTGPFRRDGQVQPLTTAKRYEGPFVDAACPAETMDIGYGHQVMRLDIS